MNRENPIHQLVNTPHTTRRVHPAQTQPDSSSRLLVGPAFTPLVILAQICARFFLASFGASTDTLARCFCVHRFAQICADRFPVLVRTCSHAQKPVANLRQVSPPTLARTCPHAQSPVAKLRQGYSSSRLLTRPFVTRNRFSQICESRFPILIRLAITTSGALAQLRCFCVRHAESHCISTTLTHTRKALQRNSTQLSQLRQLGISCTCITAAQRICDFLLW